MSQGVLPTIVGFFLVPTVGGVASRITNGVIKPEKDSTALAVASAAHALVAYGAYHFSKRGPSQGWRDFAGGGAWGSGIGAALLATWAAGEFAREGGRKDVPVAALPSASPARSQLAQWLVNVRLPQT